MFENYIRNLDISGMDVGLIALLLIACCVSCGVGVVIGSLLGKIKEGKSRKDAIKRSKAVISGQVIEQIAPLLPDFPCSPADAKFLGQPIDYVAFVSDKTNGLIDEVLFIEVKTGSSNLSKREKSLKKAVERGRVRYVEWRP